ncbi:MAG: FAD-dependent oxidoreductase [Halanaerobium sp.]|nr:FAD-dependent oxidoreductase [Halanaerobium sp.]
MLKKEFLVIGGGPAGLAAAKTAARAGVEVLLLDRNIDIGGQLAKQTHRFFGAKKEHAGTRGYKIAEDFYHSLIEDGQVEIRTGATVLGIYQDGVITFADDGEFCKIRPKRVLVATGAQEKMLSFENNDLPGVYGAGAVQTLMNLYGVLPGKRVLMVGAGNIGLIVSYQLLQAGVAVAAIVEAAPKIGGYLVHAAKIRRAGVPIHTGTTVARALGTEGVEGAVIQQLSERWEPVAGTERVLSVDTICLSAGLSPLVELLWQAGCRMLYIPELGGYVPWRDDELRTSRQDIYVAGDAAGVEEATSAILEGELVGLAVAESLNYSVKSSKGLIKDKLASLRSGPMGEKVRQGLSRIRGEDDA